MLTRTGVSPTVQVLGQASESQLSPADQLVILHYLLTARGLPRAGKSISFQELWGGRVYIDAFRRRAIVPWIQLFTKCGGTAASALDKLRGAMPKLGARRGSLGDFSIIVPVFPRLELTYVYWEGDEELEPSGNILFDAGANDYLPTEDLAYVASVPVWRLGEIIRTR